MHGPSQEKSNHFKVTCLSLVALLFFLALVKLSEFKILLTGRLYRAADSRNFSHPWLTVHAKVKHPRGTIFTCVTDRFYYLKHFLYMYTGEGYDVKVFQGSQVTLNRRRLTVHWCRLWVLLNEEFRLGPVIYIDADTKVNLTQLNIAVKNYRHFDGLIITNGTPRKQHEIRTNWFVAPNLSFPRTRALLRKWSLVARNTPLQDQRVLNDLYPSCKEEEGLLCFNFNYFVNSTHCGSHSRPRYQCMMNMIHMNEKVPVYQRSTSTRLI